MAADPDTPSQRHTSERPREGFRRPLINSHGPSAGSVIRGGKETPGESPGVGCCRPGGSPNSAFSAVTGARLSECLGLVWADLELDDVAAATVSFESQVDRQGRRQPLKTEESQRTIELPCDLAAMLVQHKLASLRSANPGTLAAEDLRLMS